MVKKHLPLSFSVITQWAKSPKKQSVGVWHMYLSAELTKTHSFRLLFWWFCPLGRGRRNLTYRYGWYG